MRFYVFLLVLLCSALSPTQGLAVNETPKVVVSIKPIHSLVSGVMQGVTKPELLMRSTQSLHHYSLKPSDSRLLANADLVFWVGPELENFLPRLLKNLPNKTRIVSLIENKNLTKLSLRQVHKDHDDEQLQLDRRIWDGHIWLDTHNADVLVDEITQHLVSIDPANTQQYKSNQKKLHAKINTLREKLHLSLSGASKPFLSYHDAYQYFEHEFKLNSSGFVTSGMDLSPGARRIRELKRIITHDSIQCLFYDAPLKPAVIGTLLANTNTKAIELDPTGMHIEEGRQAWFLIMQTLGKNFSNCLQSH